MEETSLCPYLKICLIIFWNVTGKNSSFCNSFLILKTTIYNPIQVILYLVFMKRNKFST